MFKVHNKILPTCMQELFKKRESQYALRGTFIYEKGSANSNIKGRCLSVRGVNLWNGLENDLKTSKTINSFKRIFKNKVLNKYNIIGNA